MRLIAALAAGCLAVAGTASVAAADFPTKPLSIVVPFGAGGSTDLMTRALASEMSKSLGQEVLVVNKSGASGTIGTAEVAAARNDGYTIGMLPVGPLTTQPNLRRLPYTADSFDYVCLVYANPQALLVRKDAPFKDVNEWIAHAKKTPGLKYGSSGPGSVPHMAVVALAQEIGAEMVHVPHKGDADNLSSLLGGHIEMFVTHTAFVASNPDSVRALGLMAAKRLKEVPDLPTFAEQGAPDDLHFQVWGGLAVPKGTPAPVIARLESACKAGVTSEFFRGQLAKLQTPEAYMDSKEFAAFVAAEFDRNRALLIKAGMKKE